MKENPVISSDYHLLVLGRREVGWGYLISNTNPSLSLFLNKRSFFFGLFFFFFLGLGDAFWLLLVSE